MTAAPVPDMTFEQAMTDLEQVVTLTRTIWVSKHAINATQWW